jgi:crotonobetainyl-CoA:carnitine CoA-transferase CaiB-like acyl-CoA transferase
MAQSALDGVTVLDATSGVSGAYATKLLADLGARVILLEDEAGSPLRRRPPLDGREYGVIWAHLAGGKESLVASPGPDTGSERRSLLRHACNAADILVRDGKSSLEDDLPSPLPPQLIVIDLSPFGRSGPY